MRIVFFNIKNNRYYILFVGNHGLGGMDKVIENIKNEHDVYFVVSSLVSCKPEERGCQFDNRVRNIIEENYELVEKLNYYNIYYKE